MWNVDITQPDTITVTCTAGTSSKNVTIYIIRIESLLPDEGDEFDDGDGWDPNDTPPGGSYTGDKDDPNIVGGEYPYPGDFREFSISISPSGIPQGSVTLSYPGNVKVWETTTKLDPNGLSSKADSSYEPNQLPLMLYLEGVSGSKEFQDVEVKASYFAVGGAIHEDIVKVTVFEVTLDGLFDYGPQQGDNDKHFDGKTASPPLWPVSSNKRGLISWDDANEDWNKIDPDPNCKYFHNCMECQGTVEPNSVTNQVEFNIKREKWRKSWSKNQGGDWVLDGGEPDWIDDDGTNDDEDLTPSGDNHIYSIDGPGFIKKDLTPDYRVYIGDFREWVEVKLDGIDYQCSDYYKWHAQVWTKSKDGTNDTTRDSLNKQKLGGGWITIPDEPD